MKYSKIIIISVICLIAGAIIFTVGFAMTGFNISSLSTRGETMEKTYFEEGTVSAVKIKDSNTKIELEASGSDGIYVEYKENKVKKYNIANQNGTLTIDGENSYKWYDYIFNMDFSSPKLKIFIPKDMKIDIYAETSNGKIEAENLTFNKAELITSNARIELENITSLSDMILKTSNAQVDLDCINIENELKVKTSNGKIEAENITSGDLIELITSNGAVKIENILAGKNITLSSSNGAIKGTINDKIANYTIESKTSNGNSNLPSQVFGNEKTLNISTSNGSIDVNFTK